MKLERITGGHVRRMIVEDNYRKHQETLKANAAKADQGIDWRTKSQRQQAFMPLIERQKAVTTQVRDLTSRALFSEFDDGTYKRKEVIVIGEHDETERTPDHVAVVGLSFVVTSLNSRDSVQLSWAEFSPFAIPKDDVDEVIQAPYLLDGDLPEGMVPMPVEQSMSSTAVTRETKDAVVKNRRARRRAFNKLEEAVSTSEASLLIVTDAIAIPDLNTHLKFDLPESHTDEAQAQ